jgi:hypothetical protein
MFLLINKHKCALCVGGETVFQIAAAAAAAPPPAADLSHAGL